MPGFTHERRSHENKDEAARFVWEPRAAAGAEHVGGTRPRCFGHPNMASIDQYLMPDRNAEIALARSAAPQAISRDAKILVLGHHGYETAVEGKNGFVCVVERG
jgi:hypothetical protein